MRGICIDLGTSNTVISAIGKAGGLMEPSFVTVDNEEDIIIDAGIGAKEAFGKTPENLITIKPLAKGVIADYSAAEGMVKMLMKKALKRTVFTGINAVVSVPPHASQMERRAASETVKNLGVSSVFNVESTIAAAIGAGINIHMPKGHMVVDIGGGTTDTAIITLGNIATSISVKEGGESMDAAIIAHVKRRYNIIIGENTAERIKMDVGCADERQKNVLGKYKGREMFSGLPKEFTVSSEEIREAISPVLNAIADSLLVALEKTPSELLSDVMRDGIILTGGCANLSGITEFITKKTGFKAKVADNPNFCTLKGLEKIFKDKGLKNLKKEN